MNSGSGQHNATIDIGPIDPNFTPGFQIEGHSRFGKEYDNEVKDMSYHDKHALAVFGVKFNLHTEGDGAMVLELLNNLKSMAEGIPQISKYVRDGNSVDFRQDGTSIYINISVPPKALDDELSNELSKFNLEGQDFLGKGDFKINWGVNFIDTLKASVDQCAEMATNISINANVHGENINILADTIATIIRDTFKGWIFSGLRDPLSTFFNLIPAWKLNNLSFRYDPMTLRTIFKNVLSVSGDEKSFDGLLEFAQNTVNGFVNYGQTMANDILGPFANALKAVDLGHFEFFLMVPRLRFYVRPGFTIFGLNDFLVEKIFN